jgi:hypothetical protein
MKKIVLWYFKRRLTPKGKIDGYKRVILEWRKSYNKT